MKLKLPKIFKSPEYNSELIDEAMKKYQKKYGLGDKELQPLIEDKKVIFINF